MCDSVWPQRPRSFTHGKIIALAQEYRRALKQKEKANAMLLSSPAGTEEHEVALAEYYRVRRAVGEAGFTLYRYVAGRYA